MIVFYRHTFESLGGAFWRVRFWVKEHPWWSRIIAVILIDVFLVCFGNTYWAFADGGGAAPYILGGDITDSGGVPLVLLDAPDRSWRLEPRQLGEGVHRVVA